MSDDRGDGSNEGEPGRESAPVAQLDLTHERLDDDAASTSAKTISGRRESTRSIIAYALLGVLIITSARWVLVRVLAATTSAGGAFDKIFTGILGLTGTVVGFYFGSASQENKS